MPGQQISVHASDILLKALAAYQESNGSKSRSETVLELVILGIVTSDPAQFGEAQREWSNEMQALDPEERISFHRWMAEEISPQWGGNTDMSNRAPKASDKPTTSQRDLMRQLKIWEGDVIRYTKAERRSILALIGRGLVEWQGKQARLTDLGHDVLNRYEN